MLHYDENYVYLNDRVGMNPAHSSGRPAPHADKDRFGEKLQQHMQPLCADRHAQADLPCSLGHRDEQDVHDADAADQQRDRGEQQRHDPPAAFRRLDGLAQSAEAPKLALRRGRCGSLDRRLAATGKSAMPYGACHPGGPPISPMNKIGENTQ